MSISENINIYTLGTIKNLQGAITIFDNSPTGTLGVVSELNPDALAVTGSYSVLANFTCPAYQGSVNTAKIKFTTQKSAIYDSIGNLAAFAAVLTKSELNDLQAEKELNGLDANDYVIFTQDDPQSEYRIGDRALYDGQPVPALDAWTRIPAGEQINVPIIPESPVSSTGLILQGHRVANDPNPVSTPSNWYSMLKTEAFRYYDIGTSNFHDLDITNIVKEITNIPTYQKNNKVSIIFEVTGIDGNYLFDIGRNANYWKFEVDFNPVAPFQVENLQVESLYRALDISWEAPSDDGGSPIIGYNYQYKEESDTDWTDTNGTNASTTAVTIEGLDPATYYFIRVRAVNSIGSSEWNTTPIPYAPNNNAPVPIGSLDFNSANPIRVRIRRDYSATWDAADPVLAIGEPGYVLDTHYLKVGDGITSWTGLNTIEVPDSTINFPTPPDVFLGIKDDRSAGNNAITCNLSQLIPLTIEAKSGIKAEYDDIYKAVTLSLESTFDPIHSGSVVNPQSSGSPGEVKYDNERIFICVADDLWKRVLQEQPWFNIVPLAVGDNGGQYPSNTEILAGGDTIEVQSDGDPYPAKAGTPLVNDGVTPRGGFLGGYLPAFQNYNFVILYKGGESTSDPQTITENPLAVTVNGVVIKSSKFSGDIDIFPPPVGFQYDKYFWKNYFGFDACTGHVAADLVYVYYGGGFVPNCWNTNKFYESNSYFNDTNYVGDHIRHTDGHSKIVGIAFDGYPIYGPFGYNDPLNTNGAVRRMESGYRKILTDAHRPTNYKYSNAYVINDITYTLLPGAFIQDYEYNSTYGHLDEYNGRYCKTPDYPNGTYAYFLTFSDDNLLYPAYPYIIGTSTREQRSVL